MRCERLRWIAKVIEYDRLTNREAAFLFKFIEGFVSGKLVSKTAEEYLEKLFAEVQWREDDKEDMLLQSEAQS